MNTHKVYTRLKPYYGKFRYRIRYKQLEKFSSHWAQMSILKRGQWPITKHRDVYYYEKWISYYDLPSTQQERDNRLDAYARIVGGFLDKNDNYKIYSRGRYTTIFVDDKDVVDRLVTDKITSHYLIDVVMPAIDNYDVINKQIMPSEEIRRTLYYGHYRYKILIKKGTSFESLDGLTDKLIESNVNVRMPPVIARFGKCGLYNDISLACNDVETTAHIAVLGGDIIAGIRKAVLVKELG